MLHPATTLNCRGTLVDLSAPIVMGILNATPDSFFDGGSYQSTEQAIAQCEKMLEAGATIIDIGGMSSRPGADLVSEAEEMQRVIPVVEQLARQFPDAIFSIDTVRAGVAEAAINAGAHIINDISAGKIDKAMYETVAHLGVPYVLMHMQGKPDTMQQQPTYENVLEEVLDFLIEETGKLRSFGVKDIIIDPGFGFGKTVENNYDLLKNLHVFNIIGVPILAGISRKSMICKALKISPKKALNGTTALHVIALQQGAKILRAHDVKEAMEVIELSRHFM